MRVLKGVFNVLTFSLIIGLVGCQKEDLEKKEFLEFEETELKSELNSFEQKINNGFEELKGSETISNEDLVNVYSNVKAEFPKLNNFESALDVYNKSLLISDPNELKEFVNENSRFLIYVESANKAFLTMSIEKAAFVSKEGIIQIDNRIIKIGKDEVKEILKEDFHSVSEFNKAQNLAGEKILTRDRGGEYIQERVNPNNSNYKIYALFYVDYTKRWWRKNKYTMTTDIYPLKNNAWEFAKHIVNKAETEITHNVSKKKFKTQTKTASKTVYHSFMARTVSEFKIPGKSTHYAYNFFTEAYVDIKYQDNFRYKTYIQNR